MARRRPFSQWASRVPAQCTPPSAKRGRSAENEGKQRFRRRSRENFPAGPRLRRFSLAVETCPPHAAFDDFDTTTLRRTIFPRARPGIPRRRRTPRPEPIGGGRFPKSERSGFRRREVPPTCCFPRRQRVSGNVFRTAAVNAGQPIDVVTEDRRTHPARQSDVTVRNREPAPAAAEWPTPGLAGFPRPTTRIPRIHRPHHLSAALIRSIRRAPGRKNKIVDQELVRPFW